MKDIYESAVEAGPRCLCGHERNLHANWAAGWFDGPCRVEGCACTPSGYKFPDGRPYVAPDMVGLV